LARSKPYRPARRKPFWPWRAPPGLGAIDGDLAVRTRVTSVPAPI
jgi:hypothetical protein